MAKNKKQAKDPIQQEKDYIAFLEKQLASANFKSRVSPEEYQKQQEKLKKARFKLRTLEAKKKGTKR